MCGFRLITILACACIYYKTYKTLKKYEKDFAKELTFLQHQKKIVMEKSKLPTDLASHINQFKAFNAYKKS